MSSYIYIYILSIYIYIYIYICVCLFSIYIQRKREWEKENDIHSERLDRERDRERCMWLWTLNPISWYKSRIAIHWQWIVKGGHPLGRLTMVPGFGSASRPGRAMRLMVHITQEGAWNCTRRQISYKTHTASDTCHWYYKVHVKHACPHSTFNKENKLGKSANHTYPVFCTSVPTEGAPCTSLRYCWTVNDQ